MIEPSVFVSAVSPEFRTSRNLAALVLSRLGFKPIIQEIFGTEPGDLRQVLRDKIDNCEGLIQLVGFGYGAEPPIETEFGRVSYTQFEFLYALSKAKKTWLILVEEACPRDTAIDKLDLPRNVDHPDPAGYQQERRELQEKYRNQRRSDGHLYHPVSSSDQLQVKLNGLRNELDELRREEREWRGSVTEKLVVLSAQQAITKERIRAHLLESAEQTYRKALAAAEAEPAWQQRKKLKEAAEQDQVVRLSKIDDLARSFAEIEGTSRATEAFDEMTRILASEGVDEALAYAVGLRTSILETVRTRRLMEQQKNRDELRPLLTAAELHAGKGEPENARALYEDILQLEPDWLRALEARNDFQIDQGDRALTHGTTAMAFAEFRRAEEDAKRLVEIEPARAEYLWRLGVAYARQASLAAAQGRYSEAQRLFDEDFSIAQRLTKAEPDNIEWQRNLSVALNQLGDLALSQGNVSEAQRLFDADLGIAQRLADADPGNAEWQRDLSVSIERLGDLAEAQGNLREAMRLFNDSLHIRQRLADSDSRNAEWQRDLSCSLDRLGGLAVTQGDLSEAQGRYCDSLRIAQRLADADPGNAQAQRDLSIAFNQLGELALSQGDFPEARRLFDADLGIAQRLADADPDNIEWQRNLSVAFDRLGDLAEDQDDLPEGQKLFGACLLIRQRLADSDPGNAEWQRDLSCALDRLGELAVAQGDLSKAQGHFVDSLRIAQRLADAAPGNSQAERDLSVALNQLGDLAMSQGNFSEAHRLFDADLGIAQRLADAAPGNAEWQRDLWATHSKIAELLEKQGDSRKAIAWELCCELFQKMVDRGFDISPDDLKEQEVMKAKLGKE